ncbi:MAG: DUF202 domain-containing protein [Solirubrobacteraceae bacterium]
MKAARPEAPPDPGLAGDRTNLAWTRSALSLAGTGVLTARAAFLAGLPAVGVAIGIFMAAVSLLAYRHGQLIYPRRRHPDDGRRHHQAEAFRLLDGATFLTALIAAATVVVLVDSGA